MLLFLSLLIRVIRVVISVMMVIFALIGSVGCLGMCVYIFGELTSGFQVTSAFGKVVIFGSLVLMILAGTGGTMLMGYLNKQVKQWRG